MLANKYYYRAAWENISSKDKKTSLDAKEILDEAQIIRFVNRNASLRKIKRDIPLPRVQLRKGLQFFVTDWEECTGNTLCIQIFEQKNSVALNWQSPSSLNIQTVQGNWDIEYEKEQIRIQHRGKIVKTITINREGAVYWTIGSGYLAIFWNQKKRNILELGDPVNHTITNIVCHFRDNCPYRVKYVSQIQDTEKRFSQIQKHAILLGNLSI